MLNYLDTDWSFISLSEVELIASCHGPYPCLQCNSWQAQLAISFPGKIPSGGFLNSQCCCFLPQEFMLLTSQSCCNRKKMILVYVQGSTVPLWACILFQRPYWEVLPLTKDCKQTDVSRSTRNCSRATWVRYWLWTPLAALFRISVLLASSSAIWPALRNTLVLPICCSERIYSMRAMSI